MFRKLPLALALVLVAILVAAPAAMAGNKVSGTMDLEFNQSWPGPQLTIPDWVGTLTVDGASYNMAFFAFGNGKPFDALPPTSAAFFFEEIWKVYATSAYAIDSSGNLVVIDADADTLIVGYDRGITKKNSMYHMTGTVREASGPFAGLAGRNVHMSGVIEWYPSGAPQYAPGTLRIN